MEHTPGPWHTWEQTGGGHIAILHCRGDNFGNEGIAFMDAVLIGAKHTAKRRANARLIAAAPDLLEALKSIREWLLDNDPLVDDGINHPLFIKANNLANAAIAKATP